MARPGPGPPLPDSPGRWLCAFRHRVQNEAGKAISPEDLGRRLGRSGATVRRWEADQLAPNEAEISRIAEVCGLTPLQTAFLSEAFTRTRVMPAPPEEEFRAHMTPVLSGEYPAMLMDRLLFCRAWNSYTDALGRGTCGALANTAHPMVLMLRAQPPNLGEGAERWEILRCGVRIFWITTAALSHRPEYAELVRLLGQEPGFRELWLELARGEPPVVEPLDFAYSLGGNGAQFRVFQRRIVFPPDYYLHEYVPDDDLARERLEALRTEGPPEVFFERDAHWVRAPLSIGREPERRGPRG